MKTIAMYLGLAIKDSDSNTVARIKVLTAIPLMILFVIPVAAICVAFIVIKGICKEAPIAWNHNSKKEKNGVEE